MLKKFLLPTLLFIGISLFAYTQKELEQLQNNSNWIVGKGISFSEDKADRIAINDLLSQISVQVQSSFENITTEDNNDVSEYCSSVIKTYSSARLDAAQRSVFEEGDKYIVYRYIKKSDRDKIFKDREKLVVDYAYRGDDAEKELRIGDALMNYYWSLVLLRTHPNWDKITANLNGKKETLITYLPDRIRRIYSLLNLKIVGKRYDEDDRISLLELKADYNNKPVRNLDIKYYLGSNWSDPVGITQGKALLEFFTSLNKVPKSIKIIVLYNDNNKASHNSDLIKVLEEVSCPVFRESRFTLNDKAVITKTDGIKIKLVTKSDSIPIHNYTEKINRICDAIKSRNVNDISDLLSDVAIDDFNKIIKYGNAKIIDENIQMTVDKIGNIVYIKGLPAQFTFPKSRRKFSEELVFLFDNNGKLQKINFALSNDAIKDILGKVKATNYEKFQIVNFIEQYKTAYCTKDIDFIEKVFDNNALIIVGQVLKNDKTDIEGMYRKLGKNWRAKIYTKKEYIRNLKYLFRKNEFVNLHFEDNIVTRVNSDKKKIFGIQIHQYYYSQTYSDEGYLFLMFDLTNINKPKIYVRTWQPEKNPDGSIYGLDDFYLPIK